MTHRSSHLHLFRAFLEALGVGAGCAVAVMGCGGKVYMDVNGEGAGGSGGSGGSGSTSTSSTTSVTSTTSASTGGSSDCKAFLKSSEQPAPGTTCAGPNA